MKITRIRVTSYRGIESLDQQIPEHGAIVQGGNGKGKTSVLKAIRAALSSQDVDADAIRLGSDRAEILVDLDAYSVRRVISQAGNTVTVTNAEGFKAPKPQTLLAQLLGTAPLDPLDLYLAKPADRRNKILEAMPVTVTREQMLAWAPDLPADFSCTGHGLEVIGRAHRLYYDLRAAANKSAADKKAAVALTAGNLFHQQEPVDPGVSVEEAERGLQQATEAYTAIKNRQEQAARSEVQSEGARARIASLRREADDLAAASVCAIDLQPLRDRVASTQDALDTVEAQIAILQEQAVVLREDLHRANDALTLSQREQAVAEQGRGRAAGLRQQADEQEATISAMLVAAPTTEEMDAAMEAGRAARSALTAATSMATHRAAEDALAILRAEAQEAVDRAAALDKTVRLLAKDAPSAALASAEAIPGLTLDGADVYLDGVRIEARSGAEQLNFAVNIAKRLNARTKILVVDGIERLDPDQREKFVRAATSDGFQLIASLVADGEMVLAAIESEDEVCSGVVTAL